MLISTHYLENAERSQKLCEIKHKDAQDALVLANQHLRTVKEYVVVAKSCPELKAVSKKFKAMVAFPTAIGILVQLGNIREDHAGHREFFTSMGFTLEHEVGEGYASYSSPKGHTYFVRYVNGT